MISRKILVTYLTSLTIAGLNGLSFILVARFMGPTPMGIVVYGLSFVMLFNFLPDLGFNVAHVKRISEGKDLARCNGLFVFTKLCLLAIMIITVIIVIFWYKSRNPFFEDPENVRVLFILLAYLVFQNLASIALFTFEGKTESSKRQLPFLLSAVISAAIVTYASLSGLGATALALSYSSGALILVISSFVLFRRYPVGRPSVEYFKSYFSFALPISAYSIVAYLGQYLDKFLIGTFYSVDDVAFFYGGQQVFLVIISLSTAAGILLMPTFSLLHSRNDIAGIRRLTRESERYLSMIFAPIVMFCFVFAKTIVGVFLGASFLLMVPIFQIQLAATFLAAINVPHEKQIPGIDRPGITVKASIAIVVIASILHIIFIPQQLWGIPLLGMGAIGASLVTLIASLMRLVIWRYLCYRLTRTEVQKKILVHLIIAGVMGWALYYLQILLPISNWYILIPFGIIFLAGYIGALFLLGQLKRDDALYLRNLLSPSGMRAYITSELGKKKASDE